MWRVRPSELLDRFETVMAGGRTRQAREFAEKARRELRGSQNAGEPEAVLRMAELFDSAYATACTAFASAHPVRTRLAERKIPPGMRPRGDVLLFDFDMDLVGAIEKRAQDRFAELSGLEPKDFDEVRTRAARHGGRKALEGLAAEVGVSVEVYERASPIVLEIFGEVMSERMSAVASADTTRAELMKELGVSELEAARIAAGIIEQLKRLSPHADSE